MGQILRPWGPQILVEGLFSIQLLVYPILTHNPYRSIEYFLSYKWCPQLQVGFYNPLTIRSSNSHKPYIVNQEPNYLCIYEPRLIYTHYTSYIIYTHYIHYIYRYRSSIHYIYITISVYIVYIYIVTWIPSADPEANVPGLQVHRCARVHHEAVGDSRSAALPQRGNGGWYTQ